MISNRLLIVALLILLAAAPTRAMIPASVADTSITIGQQAKADVPANTGKEGKMNPLAVVGFILAILVPPVGIALSFIAFHQAKKNHQRGRSLAKAGVIVGFSIIGALIIFSFFYLITHGEPG
jgi:Domain of unknown function (DUF4190)